VRLPSFCDHEVIARRTNCEPIDVLRTERWWQIWEHHLNLAEWWWWWQYSCRLAGSTPNAHPPEWGAVPDRVLGPLKECRSVDGMKVGNWCSVTVGTSVGFYVVCM
jgi:hypothetical protein